MHAEAERTPRHLLPGTVADVLARHDQRRAARRAVWREHTAAAHRAQRSVDLDADGLDL